MRIIVFSDSHGRTGNLFDVIEKHRNTTDMFIHLGDGEPEADMVKSAYPEIDLRYVRGNCDINSGAPMSLLIEADFGRKIYATGSNAKCAKLVGVDTTKIKIAVYAISGFLADLAGLIMISRVDYGIGTILKEAKAQGADIVLFGHTHERFSYYDSDSGIYLLNPGSLSEPRDGKGKSYGVIDIVKSGVVMNIADF